MGGGVMRAAAKVAATGNLRGFGGDHHPLSSAVRRAASVRPAAATVEDVKLVASNHDVSVTSPCVEAEDWVFAGEEVMVARDPEPISRVVFGAAPTLQEAEEATSELSAAFERAYMTSPAEGDDSIVQRGVSGLALSNSQLLENSVVGFSDAAVMAFRCLNQSPVAQRVVASIASDPNVWNAMLQNHEFQGFLQVQGAGVSSSAMNLEAEPVPYSLPSDHSTGTGSQESKSNRGSFFEKIKDAFAGMINSVSEYFNNLFGGKAGEKTSSDDFGSKFFQAPQAVLAIALLVVMVIFLKRVP